MQKKKLKISVISQIHYCKLILRSLLLVAALAAYIVSHLNGSGSMFGDRGARDIRRRNGAALLPVGL